LHFLISRFWLRLAAIRLVHHLGQSTEPFHH
jgi:hypothetical protein